jgi:hypothetical protein
LTPSSAPGYWPSPWPGEDGGPSRRQAPHGIAGLGLSDGDRLEVVSRSDVFMATMTVLRDPGEVYLLRHTFGSDSVSSVERIDPLSLEPLERSPDLAAGPFWPGGLAAHANGSLYVVYGRWCHRLAPDCQPIVSRQLPRERPYNSFVILPDGVLVTKDIITDGSARSMLSVLEPDRLQDAAPPVELPEASIARISADGWHVYVQGATSAYRYRWTPESGRLIRDDAYTRRYLTLPNQSYAWDAVVDAGQVFFMDNGDHSYDTSLLGKGNASGPVHLVRLAVAGGDVELAEISGLPHGTQTNLPLFDPERGIAVAYDSGNGVLAAWRFRDASRLQPLWQRRLNASMHMIRYPDTGELVVNDYSPERGEDVVVLDLETGAERGRAATGSFMQSVVFPAVGFARDLYYCSFTTLARIGVVNG